MSQPQSLSDGRTIPSGPTKMTPSEAFVETLVANGVTDMFGIMGSAFMDAMDIFAPAGIRLIPVVHEQGAGHMADGYARVSGRHGVVIGQNEGWNEWVEFLQANLNEVGFQAEISTLSGAANNERGASCKEAMPSNGGVSFDPLNLKGFFGTQASSNWACLDDAELDQMIEDAQAALDMDERNELIKQIQVHLMENAYEVPIVELAFYTAMKESVNGIRFDAMSFYPWMYEAYVLE